MGTTINGTGLSRSSRRSVSARPGSRLRCQATSRASDVRRLIRSEHLDQVLGRVTEPQIASIAALGQVQDPELLGQDLEVVTRPDEGWHRFAVEEVDHVDVDALVPQSGGQRTESLGGGGVAVEGNQDPSAGVIEPGAVGGYHHQRNR